MRLSLPTRIEPSNLPGCRPFNPARRCSRIRHTARPLRVRIRAWQTRHRRRQLLGANDHGPNLASSSPAKDAAAALRRWPPALGDPLHGLRCRRHGCALLAHAWDAAERRRNAVDRIQALGWWTAERGLGCVVAVVRVQLRVAGWAVGFRRCCSCWRGRRLI